MDRIDRRILGELQRDATLPLARLAERVGLSPTPCWKRVQKLEAAGIIAARVARIDAGRVGLSLTVFVEVEALDHTPEWRERFLAAARDIPAIMDVFRLGGAADYLMRVVAADMAAYDRIYRSLSEAVAFRSVVPRFVLETVLSRAELPIPEDRGGAAAP